MPIYELIYAPEKGPSAIPGVLRVGGIPLNLRGQKSRKFNIAATQAAMADKAPGWSCKLVDPPKKKASKPKAKLRGKIAEPETQEKT